MPVNVIQGLPVRIVMFRSSTALLRHAVMVVPVLMVLHNISVIAPQDIQVRAIFANVDWMHSLSHMK